MFSSASSVACDKPLTAGFGCVLPPPAVRIRECIRTWLQADVPNFDVGGFVVGDTVQTARLLGKSAGVIAGIPFAQAVFDEMGLSVEWNRADGDVITEAEATEKRAIAVVTGPVRNILLAERLALNIMARASGIATAAKHLRTLAGDWHGSVAGTRKTTPGFALVEKYALLVGGAATHRMSLSQMVMLKDNHIWSVGSIAGAVKKVRID
jgi:nicotinate-nucleotide pyrophosphorylase (carboxylating)